MNTHTRRISLPRIAVPPRNILRETHNMQVVRSDDFERALAKLPAQIRTQCEAQIVILKDD
jgi:hypothetical protein